MGGLREVDTVWIGRAYAVLSRQVVPVTSAPETTWFAGAAVTAVESVRRRVERMAVGICILEGYIVFVIFFLMRESGMER